MTSVRKQLQKPLGLLTNGESLASKEWKTWFHPMLYHLRYRTKSLKNLFVSTKYLILLFSFSADQWWWVRRGFGGSSLTSQQGAFTPLAPNVTQASATRSYQSGSASTKVEILSSMACVWSSTTAPLKHLMLSWTVSLKRFPYRLGLGTSPLLEGFMQSILWTNWRMGSLTSALRAVR